MKNLCALIIPVVFGILACGSQQSIVETAVAQTGVYEADLATALAGTLAAAAPADSAIIPESVEATPTALVAASPTTVIPKLAPGSIAIPFGEKQVSIPRQETLRYGFYGDKDEAFAVSLGIFNARPQHQFCTGRAKNLTYALRNKDGDLLDSASMHENQSTTKSVRLPDAGMYYINVTCSGSGCDAFCAEMIVSIEKE